jgi:multidrug efflux pump subunit AcrB
MMVSLDLEKPVAALEARILELQDAARDSDVDAGAEIAKLPLVTLPDGLVLTVGDLGTVRDEFADVAATNRINGRPGMVVSIDRSSGEDLLAMVAAVKKYVATAKLPSSIPLIVKNRPVVSTP